MRSAYWTGQAQRATRNLRRARKLRLEYLTLIHCYQLKAADSIRRLGPDFDHVLAGCPTGQKQRDMLASQAERFASLSDFYAARHASADRRVCRALDRLAYCRKMMRRGLANVA